MSQAFQTPPHSSRSRSMSVYSPLTAYMDSAVLPANLPPSLTDAGSSSPFSSPRTMIHSGLHNFTEATPRKTVNWHFSFQNLSSSPPDMPATPKPQLSRTLQPPYEPNRLESAHFAAAITTRRKSAPAAVLFEDEKLKRTSEDAGLATAQRRKQSRNSDSLADNSEFGLQSSKFRFVVDDKGHVSLRSPKTPERPVKKRNALSNKEIDQILSADSDSESESEFGGDPIVSNDAISAFARTLARSRVGQLETKGHRSHDSAQEPEFYSFSTVCSEREPRTPTSSGSLGDGCARISRLLQGSTATPPGAVYGFDALNSYATGMTPYLPRS